MRTDSDIKRDVEAELKWAPDVLLRRGSCEARTRRDRGG